MGITTAQGVGATDGGERSHVGLVWLAPAEASHTGKREVTRDRGCRDLASPVSRHPGPATRCLPPVPSHPTRMGARWADPPAGSPAILPPVPVVVPIGPGMPWGGRRTHDLGLWGRRSD